MGSSLAGVIFFPGSDCVVLYVSDLVCGCFKVPVEDEVLTGEMLVPFEVREPSLVNEFSEGAAGRVDALVILIFGFEEDSTF